MIDIDSPPLQKKRYTIFIPREIEDKAYAQFRGGGGGGGRWVRTSSVMGDVQEHIFPSTLSTDEASEDSFRV